MVMKIRLLIFTGILLVLQSWDLKGKKVQKDAENANKAVTVTLVKEDYAEIVNSNGKAILYVVPANMADGSASKLAEVSFETKELPFSVTFEFPKSHRSLIQGHVSDQDSLIYYVGLEWDSNGDGQIDSLDLSIDYDTQYPSVDLDKIDHQVIIK